MANPFVSGSLEVNPSHALAANMLVGLVPRAGNIIRDIVSSADMAVVQGSVNYTFDSEGWLGGGGGNLQFYKTKTGVVNYAAARSFVIVATNDPNASGYANQYWLYSQPGGTAASMLMYVPEYLSTNFIEPFIFTDAASASWTTSAWGASYVAGDQMAYLYNLPTGGPQTSRLIVNAGTIQAREAGAVNLATGSTNEIRIGPLGPAGKIRCAFAFDKTLSNAEFTALVADLGATARVIGGGGADVTAPTLNGDPTIGVRTTTTLAVQWPAGTDAVGVTSAEISKDDGATWVAANSVLGHTLTGLTPAQSYQIKYRLSDAAPNTSVASAAVTGTTLAGTVTVYARGSMVWPAGLTSPDYPVAGDQIRGVVFRGWHGGTAAGTAPTADYTTAAAVIVSILTVTASGYTWQAQLPGAYSAGEKGFIDYCNRHGSQVISPTTHFHAGGEFTAAV